MVKEICSLLKVRLTGLPFVDVIAGVVQPVIDVKYSKTAGTGTQELKIERRMPVSYDLVGEKSAILGMERQLVPNEAKRGICYFEDFGTGPGENPRAGGGGSIPVVSTIRYVCWMNKKKMGQYKYAELTALCEAMVIQRLVNPQAINQDGITRLFVTLQRIPIQNADIFSRYNYAEAELQYLRPPFEYFAIDFQAKYSISPNCLPNKLFTEDE